MPKNGEWVDATTERFIYQVRGLDHVYHVEHVDHAGQLVHDVDQLGQKFASCPLWVAGE